MVAVALQLLIQLHPQTNQMNKMVLIHGLSCGDKVLVHSPGLWLVVSRDSLNQDVESVNMFIDIVE